jgi:hypothetical protein
MGEEANKEPEVKNPPVLEVNVNYSIIGQSVGPGEL